MTRTTLREAISDGRETLEPRDPPSVSLGELAFLVGFVERELCRHLLRGPLCRCDVARELIDGHAGPWVWLGNGLSSRHLPTTGALADLERARSNIGAAADELEAHRAALEMEAAE
jgi:hypothetical protein